LYCEEFNFHGTHKLFLFGNYKPIVSGTDEGIWRRLKFVPWNTFIPEEKRDRGIVPRLASEAAGILNWMIEGCREWQKTGLATPAVIDEAVDEYREDEDLLEQFIKAQCKMEGEIERGIFASNVKLWMESQGYKWSLSPHAIGGRIAKIDGITKRESNGKRFWVGLSMKDPKAFIHR
jgi:putative DNA primase/helicase